MATATQPEQTTQTALAPVNARLIRSHGDLTALLQHWQQHQVHALCPTVDFGALPAQYVLVPALVKIDPDPKMGDVYYREDFCGPDEVALTATALQKIANCAGISLFTQRTDPRTALNYWEFRATATWTSFDGTKQHRTATKEWDLRDGAEQIKGFKPRQIAESRKHGSRNAETRAINAVIRQLGVKQKYSRKELERPFGLVRVVFQPDMKDPVQRAVVAQNALGSGSTMYPTALPPAADVINGEIVREEPASTSTTAAADDFDPVPAAEAKPQPQTRYTVTAVQKQERPGQGPLFYVLTEQTGATRLHTEDEALAREALRAKKAGLPIELTSQVEQDATHHFEATWILELRVIEPATAGSQPSSGACTVVKVDEKSGTNSRGPWTLYTITFSTGEQGTTFSRTDGEAAKAARDAKTPVTPRLEDDPKYPNQQNVTQLIVGEQKSFLESEL